jgi:hypothetical protein
MRRITFNVTDEQFELLKERERQTGATQSEQIRRAIAASFDAAKPTKQPVLFTPRES